MTKLQTIYSPETLTKKAKALFAEERSLDRLNGWFRIKEIQMECDRVFSELPPAIRTARTLQKIAEHLPLSISEHAVFAGTQRDAFARSYALINPAFEVESFSGYCDPTAVFNDIEPDETLTKFQIERVRDYNRKSEYACALDAVYREAAPYTDEVCFFIEQVTGHLIPDMRGLIARGVQRTIAELDQKLTGENDETRRRNYTAMKLSLEAVVTLASRYAALAREQAKNAPDSRRAELLYLAETLDRVPVRGATGLFDAIQSFLLLWQMMCIEQSPNPFAFSVGNADRIFEPYRAADAMSRETASAIFKHFLVFFNVGDRSWAISQNIIVGGKSESGGDLSNVCTYALLDAYYDTNFPQPILSVKLHRNTPDALYAALGRFFFTPGCLTPSLFNDDAMFEVLSKAGVEKDDLPDYSIAGCQEPLIMGKDNGNTTNSWLNLAKILELTLLDGVSSVSGSFIGPRTGAADPKARLAHLRELFCQNLNVYCEKMSRAANAATEALSLLPVPFLSVLMGGVETGYDTRDTLHQGTKYNGSGCLIHGLSVVSDSFVAVDRFLQDSPGQEERLLNALRTDFLEDEELRQQLLSYPKFGNNLTEADEEARKVAEKAAEIVSRQKNSLGNPFRPDFSTPSTHLLYGYWVGATPDGRKSREMLNYGTDPLYGEAQGGLGFRLLSSFCLPYDRMNGGYASHFGIDPKYFRGESLEDKGLEFKNRVVTPLFFNPLNTNPAPFYLYVNVTTAETLRRVLADPKKYAPGGIYIMRIHGTFVNFLDLSPAIQNDIILRLDPASTTM